MEPSSGPRTAGTGGGGNAAAANIRAIVELERDAARRATRTERFGERISDAIGSMMFVLLHIVALAAWTGWNVLAAAPHRFDPYPFGLLTFIVSLEGVFIATFVLIAQNRMSRHSDHRDHLNLQIVLLSEQEMTLMLRMLRRISQKLGVAPENQEAAQAERLTADTNVFELMQDLERKLPKPEDD